jgi:hypothetical protein
MAHLSILRLRIVAAAAVLALAAGPARAAVLIADPDCSASGNSLGCRLGDVLSFLYIAAAVLAFVLVLVIVLAVRSFRKRAANAKERP